jgi:hypothetical protein
MRRMIRSLANNGHTRNLSPFRLPHSKRNNIDVEPPKERSNARKNAGLVLYQSYEGVEHALILILLFRFLEKLHDEGQHYSEQANAAANFSEKNRSVTIQLSSADLPPSCHQKEGNNA